MENEVLSCLQYVPASEIWPGAKDYIDEGQREGLVRGYNVEVKKADGTTGWDSAVYIRETIEEYLKDSFTQLWFADRGVVATGRICFRGYGYITYHLYAEIIVPCDANGKEIAA